jgi:hypothetical protein
VTECVCVHCYFKIFLLHFLGGLEENNYTITELRGNVLMNMKHIGFEALAYNAEQSGGSQPALRRNMPPPYSGMKSKVKLSLCITN